MGGRSAQIALKHARVYRDVFGLICSAVVASALVRDQAVVPAILCGLGVPYFVVRLLVNYGTPFVVLSEETITIYAGGLKSRKRAIPWEDIQSVATADNINGVLLGLSTREVVRVPFHELRYDEDKARLLEFIRAKKSILGKLPVPCESQE